MVFVFASESKFVMKFDTATVAAAAVAVAIAVATTDGARMRVRVDAISCGVESMGLERGTEGRRMVILRYEEECKIIW